MKCREYIFKLTSGQLAQAGLLDQLEATAHRWSCRHCRAFTRNDEALDRILTGYASPTSITGKKGTNDES